MVREINFSRYAHYTGDHIHRICVSLLHMDVKNRNHQFRAWNDDTVSLFIYISSGVYGEINRTCALKILRKYILFISPQITHGMAVFNHIMEYKQNHVIFDHKKMNRFYELLLFYDAQYKSRDQIHCDLYHIFEKIQKEEDFYQYIHTDPYVAHIIQYLVDRPRNQYA